MREITLISIYEKSDIEFQKWLEKKSFFIRSYLKLKNQDNKIVVNKKLKNVIKKKGGNL